MFAKLTFISLLIHHILLFEQKEGIKNCQRIEIFKFCLEQKKVLVEIRKAGTRGKLTREFLLSPQTGRNGAELPHQDDPLLEEEEVGSKLQKHNMRYMEEEPSEFGCGLPSPRSVSPSFSFRLLVWCLIMSG